MKLSAADAGQVRVRVGETLELVLPETAATGAVQLLRRRGARAARAGR